MENRVVSCQLLVDGGRWCTLAPPQRTSLNPRSTTCNGQWTTTKGFTLVELMVSIAIALLLIIGINQIFGIAQRTVGAGNQLSDAVRANRMFQARLYQDFRSMVWSGANGADDAPFFIIVGEAQQAWR